MMSEPTEIDQILGSQQDQIAKDRYELAKLTEQVPFRIQALRCATAPS
jgi:hypothetical protein